MSTMPRPRPPHLIHERTRHGAPVWYVRVGKGPRIRIKATYGTAEFAEAYRAALAGEAVKPAPAASTGTLRWLVDRYRQSSEWTALSKATRRQRDNIFWHVLQLSGDQPFAAVTKATIAKARDRRSETPFAALNFLKTMRGFFRWAEAAGYVESDPTYGVKGKTPRTEGFEVWTEDEAARFESRWPVGTRERLAFDLLIYTGLRRGDVARLGRQHIRDGVLTMRTEKTGEVVTLPILLPLAASIAATRTGDLALVATGKGGPFTKESFGAFFREACDAAGVRKSAHGLRKLGATRAAENGATVAQLEAIFGWRGGKMAALYTREADRKRLAKDATGKLVREIPIPGAGNPVRGAAGTNGAKSNG
jgi:integrase